MVEQTQNDNSLFRRVITEEDSSGELKSQVSIDLTKYDTSKMSTFKEGDKVYTGFTCKIATLKPLKKFPRARIDINPANKELRDAIMAMYAAFDKVVGVKLK